MNDYFAYIFGAGASCNSLPLVKDFQKRLQDHLNDYVATFKFTEQEFPQAFRVDKSKNEIRVEFIKDIEWLISKLIDHFSIDTYARKLFLTNEINDYRLLKFLTSEFLLIQELVTKRDQRYDAFLATVLEKDQNGIVLPSNLIILNWNYDKQIELSLSNYLPHKDILSIEDFVQCFPRDKSIDWEEGFGLFKLNGTIGGATHKGKYIAMNYDLNDVKNINHPKVKQNVISNSFFRYYTLKRQLNSGYMTGDEDYSNSIEYSWEENEVVKNTRTNALKASNRVSILTVIGYSFPTFNRTMDKEILSNMENLDKIYLQSHPDSIDSVKQRLESLIDSKIQVIPIDYVDEFFIPYEFK